MAEHEHGHEDEVVSGEDEQARAFNRAVMIERGRQAAKGYDAAHDDAHGLDHLLMWSQRYAARGQHVKAQALVQAAREYLSRRALAPDVPSSGKRDDLIAAGVDPSQLEIPLHPGPNEQEQER